MMVPLMLWATSGQAQMQDDDGNYLVSSVQDLKDFADLVNSGEEEITVLLTADLDLAGEERWIPIGLFDDNGRHSYFRGTFDGQGHVIKNLRVYQEDGYESGLFGRCYKATVKNLGVINASVTNTQGIRCGVIAGQFNEGTLTNCFTAGDITITSDNEKNELGGLAGEAANAQVSNCYTTYEVAVPSMGDNGILTNCYEGGQTEALMGTGELCFLLNGDQSEIVFYQTIGTDPYPVLDNTRGQVYAIGDLDCGGRPVGDITYTNTKTEIELPAHDYDEEGICSVCGHEDGAVTMNPDGWYEVTTPSELRWISRHVTAGNRGIAVRLMNDLDLSEIENFPPIGKYSDTNGTQKDFNGTFDGQYHVIYNLKVDIDDTFEAGLFSRAAGATIRNLGIVNAQVTNRAGVRAGVLGGELHNCTVTNCFTAGDLQVSTDHAQCCAFAGEAAGSNLTGCYTTGENFTNAQSSANGCYYGEGVADMALSGELCYRLNGSSIDKNKIIWFQTLGEDDFPIFDRTHGLVYQRDVDDWASATEAEEYTELVELLVQNELDKWDENMASERLLESYTAKLEEMRGMDYDSYIAAYNAIAGLREAVEASHNAYATYLAKIEEVKAYIEAHGAEFEGPDRDKLDSYLGSATEPGDEFEHGSYLYIIDHPTLTTLEVTKETATVEQMLTDAVNNGFLTGAEVTGMLQNPTFAQGDTGWDINLGNNPTGITTTTAEGGVTAANIPDHKTDLSQTLTGLKNGVYLFRLNSYLELEDGGTPESAYNYLGYVYANDTKNYVHSKYTDLYKAEDLKEEWVSNGWFREESLVLDEDGNPLWGCASTTGLSIAFGDGHYDNCILANVTDGTLTVGVHSGGVFGRSFDTWLGNARLYYCGTLDEATKAIDEVLGSMMVSARHLCNDYEPSVTYSEAPAFDKELTAQLQQALNEAEAAGDNAAKYAAIGKLGTIFASINECKSAYLEMIHTLEEAQAAAYDQMTDPDMLAKFEELYNDYISCYENQTITQAEAEQRIKDLQSTVYYKMVYGEEPALVDGYYQIGTPYELLWFSKTVNAGDRKIKAQLTADIDLSVFENFTPIGLYSDALSIFTHYNGEFDGQGHIISNLNVTLSREYEGGLFSRTNSAYLHDFGVVNAHVVSEVNVRVGVVAGECHVSTVENVFTAGEIIVETTHEQCGGMFGEAANTSLVNCYTTHPVLAASASTVNCIAGAADMAATGELAFRMNEGLDKPVYFQTLPGDAYPVLDPTHGVVYVGGVINCAGEMEKVTFANDPDLTYTREKHEFGEDGLCKHCGETVDACETDKDGNFLIATAKNLAWFSDYVNKGHVTASARLTADIDMTGVAFSPIGRHKDSPTEDDLPNRNYSGTLDGQGHVISNITISVDKGHWGGLVGFLFGGAITNLGVDGATVSCEDPSGCCIGVLAGEGINLKVDNCFTTGEIVLPNGAAKRGGLFGWLHTGFISNCFTTYSSIGVKDSSVENCYAYSDVIKTIGTGELCYALNGNTHKEPAWYQNLGEDPHPVLDSTHAVVYASADNSYTNNVPELMKYAGTKDDPFIINTPQELQELATFMQSDTLNYVVLNADLDMSGITEWTPLNPTTATHRWIDFDGQGHVIRNFAPTNQTGYQSLFGIMAGSLRNLGVENATVNTTTSGTGLISGYVGHTAYGKPTRVEHVYVTGDLTVKDNYAGGMFGTVGDTVVMKNCYARVDIHCEDVNIGGVIARVRGALTMENVYAAGSFTRGGGIIGGDQTATTPASTFKNVAVWNNEYENFGNLRLQDNFSNISYYYGNNFAELQKTVVAWDPNLWSCDMQEGSYPVLVGIVTAIDGIVTDAPQTRKGIYDLTGRKLSPNAKLAKGVYVIDGKKVAVGK